MLRGFAYYAHHAFSTDDFAFIADRFHRGADFHGGVPIYAGEVEYYVEILCSGM
jgi:hypothetical protein